MEENGMSWSVRPLWEGVMGIVETIPITDIR